MSWLDDLLYGYRTIRNALGVDATARGILKFVGATVTDDPTTGATVVTIAGGTPLASLTGSAMITIDASNPTSPIVSIDAGTSLTGPGAARTIKGQNALQSGDNPGGELRLSGGSGHGTGTDGGAALQVDEVTVLRVYEEAAFGGVPVVGLGVVGGVAGVVIEETCAACEVIFYPKSTAGPGASINVSGQDATDGDGGGLSFNGGSKGGSGTKDGKITFGAGGKEFIKVDDGLVTIGNISNSSTASVKLAGPVGTTVGAAGGASPLPATPNGYLRVKIQGTDRLLPFFSIP